MTKTRDLADLGGGFIQAGSGAAQRTVESKLQDVVSVKDFGAVGNGTTNDTTAFVNALNTGKSIYIPKGVYYLESSLSFPTGDDKVRRFYGDGYEATILLFNGVNGISCQASGSVLSDFSIINRASSSSGVGPWPFNPIEANINSALVGLRIFGNAITAERVRVLGFGVGIRIDTKYYNTLINCRAELCLEGIKNESNFNRSYGGYYSNNFKKNIWVLSGNHDFHDCSIEGCAANTNTGSNYPDGGVLIGPTSPSFPVDTTAGPRAAIHNCYMEDNNVYLNDSLYVDGIYAGANVRVKASYPLYLGSRGRNGIQSKNLCSSLFRGNTWTGDATEVKNPTQVDSNKRYAIVTSSTAAGITKYYNSPSNALLKDWKIDPADTAPEFVYFGAWIQLKTSNFTATYPNILIQAEDEFGALFALENIDRTQKIDHTLIDQWQFVGGMFQLRNAFSTGNNLIGLKLRLSLGDGTEDHSSSNRILWFAEPEIKFIYANPGAKITNTVDYNQLSEGGPIWNDTGATTIPGNLTVSSGNLTVSSGNVVVSNGNGIDFSATSQNVNYTSELFNDYEEGTWVPTLTTSGTNFSSVTYTATTAGKYIKVGKVVHVQGVMLTSSVTVGSASGTVSIGGLPFTVSANTSGGNGNSSLSINTATLWSTNNPCAALVVNNSTRVELQKRTTANGGMTDMAVADVDTGATKNYIIFAGTYISN